MSDKDPLPGEGAMFRFYPDALLRTTVMLGQPEVANILSGMWNTDLYASQV
jgi:hypothetical protein